MAKVSIIIVTHNSGAFIEACLRSVFAQTYTNFEVIVVDNASTDDTVIQVNHVGKNHNLSLHVLADNTGFSVGCNEGMKYVTGEYVALLNPDTEVDSHWLEYLVRTLEKDDRIGAVGCKIYLGKSKYLDSVGSLYNNILNAWSRGVYELDIGQYDRAEEVPMVTACAMLLQRRVLTEPISHPHPTSPLQGEEIKLFDPDFFMYVEELDLALRMRNAGYRTLYQPKSVVWHFKSRSVEKYLSSNHDDPLHLPLTKGERKAIFFKQYHGNINRAKLIGKYLTGREIGGNLHSILLSFLYWDWYFFIHGRWGWLIKMVLQEWHYFFKGLLERDACTRKKLWRPWLQQMSLRDLIRFKKELECKQRLYEKNR